MKDKIEMMLEEAEHDSVETSVRYISEDIIGEVKELINDNSSPYNNKESKSII